MAANALDLFINDNKDLLRDYNHFDELYKKWDRYNYYLTNFLYEAGIEPAKYLKILPTQFLQTSPTSDYDIPSNIIEIGRRAFYYVSNIEKVHISRRVSRIQSEAFANCHLLNEVIFKAPGSLQTIADRAFEGCRNLTEIYLPKSVTYIGSYCFFDCSKLSYINIPDGVKNIYSSTFYRCPNLEKVDLGEGLESIEFQAFCNCSKLKNIKLPDGLKVIGNSAFQGCTGLTKLVIPSSVEIIESNAFADCGALEFEYLGNKKEWRKISQLSSFTNTNYTCHCTDGVIKKAR